MDPSFLFEMDFPQMTTPWYVKTPNLQINVLCLRALILYIMCEHSELICIYIEHMYIQSNLLRFIVCFP